MFIIINGSFFRFKIKKTAFLINLFILILINIKYIALFKYFGYNPKISIFLPIYNKEKYIEQCIKNLQNQSLKDIEIIAVNDGSTDNTLKKLKQLSIKDKRIKIINNDRNHGLLYSRAMGILNSTGQYLINLDPDDKLVSTNNLMQLYKTMKSKDLDLIIYKIKRVPLNRTEKKIYKYMDDIQFDVIDDHITNKIIEKNLFLKAFNEFRNEIFGQKWNFHEDNIWCILVKLFSKKSAFLNKFIYLYKRNSESLNMQKGTLNDVKSTIYRLKKINTLNNINNKFNYQFSLMINLYQVLKDFEIKNNLVKIAFLFRKLYENNDKKYKLINCALNIISERKIIIFNNTERNKKMKLDNESFFNTFRNNSYLVDQIMKSSDNNKFHKFISMNIKNNRKRIIFIETKNHTILENIKNYIFKNDIIIIFNNSVEETYINNIIKSHDKKNVIIF